MPKKSRKNVEADAMKKERDTIIKHLQQRKVATEELERRLAAGIPIEERPRKGDEALTYLYKDPNFPLYLKLMQQERSASTTANQSAGVDVSDTLNEVVKELREIKEALKQIASKL